MADLTYTGKPVVPSSKELDELRRGFNNLTVHNIDYDAANMSNYVHHDFMHQVLIQLKIMNIQLSHITGVEISDFEVEEEL